MAAYNDSLRGYAFPIHSRDGFKCVYCGLDGTKSYSAWLCLSLEHLLPRGNRLRDTREYMVTACLFCNAADNHYFAKASERGITFKDKNRQELVAQRTPYVLKTRESYHRFWKSKVRVTR
jgi:hypothetical protein